MSEQVWFTADTHFGHAMMLRQDRSVRRPFANVEEMNEGLITNWNAVVGEKDRVYHLGDVSFMKAGETYDILRRLNGHIHLIRGNHDNLNEQCRAQFESVHNYHEIRVAGQKIILCHYALLTWNKMHHGSWMLHGHSHSSLQVDYTKPRLDVGVDAVAYMRATEPDDLYYTGAYRPIHFGEVQNLMRRRVFLPIDHHGKGGESD